MKKILLALTIAALFCLTAFAVSAKEYYIYTPEDVYNVRKDLTGTYYLMNDIDLSGYSNWEPIGSAVDNGFSGTFNGQGFKIKGLTIVYNEVITSTGYSNHYVGLFGCVNEGVIIGVGVDGNVNANVSSINGNELNVGGLVGTIQKGRIENSCSNVIITATSSNTTVTVSGMSAHVFAGGLVGYNDYATISNCYATGKVVANVIGNDLGNDAVSSTAGGLIGYNLGFINDCYAKGDVYSNTTALIKGIGSYAGGLVGINEMETKNSYATGNVFALSNDRGSSIAGGLFAQGNAVVEKCYATGDVNSTSTSQETMIEAYAGGLVGEYLGKKVNFCYSTGSVSVESTVLGDASCANYVGGLIGGVSESSSYITNSYATGNVNSKAKINGVYSNISSYVGGFIGSNCGHVNNCYSVGNVNVYSESKANSISSYAGGFFGRLAWGSVQDCYTRSQVQVKSVSTGGNYENYVGGFVGYINSVSRDRISILCCYSAGTVNCITQGGRITEKRIGGFVGESKTNVMNGCFYNSEIAPSDKYANGLTYENIKSGGMFNYFDYRNTWFASLNRNDGYPYLRNIPVETNLSVFVNGTRLDLDIHPLIVDGRTLIPLRAVFESLGADVEWNQSTKTVIGTRNGIKIVMQVGNSSYTVNGTNYTLDVAPMIIDGRTLVPVRAVAESFGVKVDWNAEDKTVYITSFSTDYNIPESYDLLNMSHSKIREILKPYFSAYNNSYVLEELRYPNPKVEYDRNDIIEDFMYGNVGTAVSNFASTDQLYNEYLYLLTQWIDPDTQLFARIKSNKEHFMDFAGFADHNGKVYSYLVFKGNGESNYMCYLPDTAVLIDAYDNKFLVRAEFGIEKGRITNSFAVFTFEYKNDKLLLTNVE